MAFRRRFPISDFRFPALLLVSFVLSCGGTASLKPVSSPDPDVACPGGRIAWNLQINDQRAQRTDSERLLSLLRDSLSRSLPGCSWAAGLNAPAIAIEIHRFKADQQGNMWDAAAEWTVSARDAAGRTLTEFQVESEITRPNYRGSNNEVEALREVFENAMKRTLAGLRAVPPAA
jgi:hypothetical protein